MKDFDKKKIALRYSLIGLCANNPKWAVALKAMDLAEKYHEGTRKDGKTPEVQHQFEIALYLLTLVHQNQKGPEIIAAALLHDLYEDYGDAVSLEEIAKVVGWDIANEVHTLSKIKYLKQEELGTVSQVKMVQEAYFEEIAASEVASIVKGADRINNLQSMKGVFSKEKQMAYIQEAETFFLPMLKTARRNFPEHSMVYENIKLMMSSQLSLLKYALGL